MRVRALHRIATRAEEGHPLYHNPGAEVDVPDEEAEGMIGQGLVEKVEGKAAKRDAPKPDPEQKGEPKAPQQPKV